MPRHQALAALIVLILIVTIAASRSALNAPHATEEPLASQDPINDLGSRVDQLGARYAAIEAAIEELRTEPVDEDPGPQIIRVDVDGRDLADLFDVQMWKFRFSLPQDTYTGYVWIEYWTREARSPSYELIDTFSGSWTESDVAIKLPTDEDNELFVRMGDFGNRYLREGTIVPPSPVRWSILNRESLAVEQPVHLITIAHNATEKLRGGLRDVHRDHDATVYVKIGFVKGSYVRFDPKAWIPGSEVIE